VNDDPEALEVLAEMKGVWRDLPPALRDDVALLVLPLRSRVENALMVNVLQRSASLVAQNSLREGFGLTVTEAMWKRCAVLASPACGLRQQIRHGVNGHLLASAEDPEEIADALEQLLIDPHTREAHGRAAQLRVQDEFLVFNQVQRWLEVLTEVVRTAGNRG